MKQDNQVIDPIVRRLRHLLLFLVACLLGVSICFLWRLSVLVSRVDQTIVTFSDDFKQITSTAAEISQDVSEIRAKMQKMEDKLENALPMTEIETAVDAVLEVAESIRSDSRALPPEVESEIKHLLKALRRSGLKLDERGKERSMTYLCARLYAKYRSIRNTLSSTEDFIDRVATKTVSGKTYYLVDENGQRRMLKDWMSDHLKRQRSH